MDINSTAVDLAGKLNKPRAFQLGDPVIHKSTGLCGTVEAVESYGTADGQIVGVALLSGKHIRGLRREEFALHHPGVEQIRAQSQGVVTTASTTDKGEDVLIARIEGSISTASILNELS